MKRMALAGMALCALMASAHAEEQKLYCYEAGGNHNRVTFTRDATNVYMHNEITGKDYSFPILREEHAQIGDNATVIFKGSDKYLDAFPDERMLWTVHGETEYTRVRSGTVGWRYACYHQPNEHPDTCVDFNGSLGQCSDIEPRKEMARKYRESVSPRQECISRMWFSKPVDVTGFRYGPFTGMNAWDVYVGDVCGR